MRWILLLLTVIAIIACSGCIAPINSEDTNTDGTPTVTHSPPSPSPTLTVTPTPTRPTPDVTVFDVKVAVNKKYDIGTSFGMPNPISEDRMNDVITHNNGLVNQLVSEYNVSRDNTRRLYVLIQRFQQIRVTELENGEYKFTVKDGMSCVITTIEGRYTPIDGEVLETGMTEESVPC